jgi:serine/threonine protein kinase
MPKKPKAKFTDGFVHKTTIGRGSFGVVSLVKCIEDKVVYVMKKIVFTGKTAEDRDASVAEVNLLSDLVHPNVVRYHSHGSDKRNLYIVMEFCEGGDLAQMIQVRRWLVWRTGPAGSTPAKSRKGRRFGRGLAMPCWWPVPVPDVLNSHVVVLSPSHHVSLSPYLCVLSCVSLCLPLPPPQAQGDTPFDENTILAWLTQLVMGLRYVHDKKILHRDLKTQNVFLTGFNIVKLGDFGIAKVCVRRHWCVWGAALLRCWLCRPAEKPDDADTGAKR